jgi:hypothetical protein
LLDTPTIIEERGKAEEERSQQPGSGLQCAAKPKIPDDLLMFNLKSAL